MAIKNSSDKSLLREITIVLIVKLALLFFIWHSFFSGDSSPITHHDIADKVFGDIQSGDNL